MRVELVFFTGCPNVPAARERLAEALTSAGLPVTWKEWDTLDPSTPSAYGGYASPTVLLDGRAITTASDSASGLRCDLSGGPTVQAIKSALLSHVPRTQPIPTLETERLLLRSYVPADALRLEQLAGAREVADTTVNIPHPYPAGAGAEWIASRADAWDQREHLTLAICLRTAPQETLGTISLRLTEAQRQAELGYWLGVPYWGQGYATEAGRALIAFGFAELGLHRIQARHFQRNQASGRVMQKLGMRMEGVHRAAFLRAGRFEDIAMYAVLATD
jgi:[ribosomal protein S5]-alanine N-acetyltransferase